MAVRKNTSPAILAIGQSRFTPYREIRSVAAGHFGCSAMDRISDTPIELPIRTFKACSRLMKNMRKISGTF